MAFKRVTLQLKLPNRVRSMARVRSLQPIGQEQSIRTEVIERFKDIAAKRIFDEVGLDHRLDLKGHGVNDMLDCY